MATQRGVQVDRPAGADVTASELASFAYCAKAWHLERVIGVRVSDAASRQRDAGKSNHERHGSHVHVGSRLGRRARSAIIMLLALGALFGTLAVLAA